MTLCEKGFYPIADPVETKSLHDKLSFQRAKDINLISVAYHGQKCNFFILIFYSDNDLISGRTGYYYV